MRVAREGTVSEYLTEALLQLMSKKTFEDISVTDLCKRAGVTRMSFYRNYDSKEAILRQWITTTTDSFLEESQISFKNDPLPVYFQKLFTHMKKHLGICQHIYRAGMIHLIKNEFDRIFLSFHMGDYDEYKSYFLAGGVYNVFLLWLVNGGKETPAQLAGKLENLLER